MRSFTVILLSLSIVTMLEYYSLLIIRLLFKRIQVASIERMNSQLSFRVLLVSSSHHVAFVLVSR